MDSDLLPRRVPSVPSKMPKRKLDETEETSGEETHSTGDSDDSNSSSRTNGSTDVPKDGGGGWPGQQEGVLRCQVT